MLYKNTNGTGVIGTDGFLTLTTASGSNPVLLVQAKEVQDWSVATKYWIGFRTKTSAQNGAACNIFALSDSLTDTNFQALLQETDMSAASAATLNVEYYVEVMIDRTNLLYEVWVNGVKIKNGSLAAAALPAGGNGYYWFGAYNSASGVVNGSTRSFRDYYFLDVDSTTPSRLGSVKSTKDALTVSSAPNYEVVLGSSFVGSAALSAAQSKFGGQALSVPGSGSYLSVPAAAAQQAIWAPGTSDFTLEGWIYVSNIVLNSADNSYVWPIFFWGTWMGGTSAYLVNYSMYYFEACYGVTGGAFAFIFNNAASSATFIMASNAKITRNAWHHVAYVRKNGTLSMYLDGVQVGSSVANTANISVVTNNAALFGQLLGGGTGNVAWYSYGYMDEFRWSNNARYSTAFTPPAVAFTPDANTMLLQHFDTAYQGSLVDPSYPVVSNLLQAGYPSTPSMPPYVMDGGSGDALTFGLSQLTGKKILALDFRLAAQASNSPASLSASLQAGSNSVAMSCNFTDSLWKYGRRLGLQTNAPDGAAWTSDKLAASSLVLTPSS
jgi:hypothetical protein